jgi:hypothetical protein
LQRAAASLLELALPTLKRTAEEFGLKDEASTWNEKEALSSSEWSLKISRCNGQDWKAVGIRYGAFVLAVIRSSQSYLTKK